MGVGVICHFVRQVNVRRIRWAMLIAAKSSMPRFTDSSLTSLALALLISYSYGPTYQIRRSSSQLFVDATYKTFSISSLFICFTLLKCLCWCHGAATQSIEAIGIGRVRISG